MPAVDDAERLAHMLDYARIALRLARGHARHDLDTDLQFSLAVVRALEIVGEAASRVSSAGRARLPGIPWPEIVGFRNRLVHGYDVLDCNLIWQIIERDLPPLIANLEKAVPPSSPA